jgi:hypothetical protein
MPSLIERKRGNNMKRIILVVMIILLSVCSSVPIEMPSLMNLNKLDYKIDAGVSNIDWTENDYSGWVSVKIKTPKELPFNIHINQKMTTKDGEFLGKSSIKATWDIPKLFNH